MPNDSIAAPAAPAAGSVMPAAATMDDYAASRSAAVSGDPSPPASGDAPAAPAPADSAPAPVVPATPDAPAAPAKADGGFQRRIDKLTRDLHDERRQKDMLLETMRATALKGEQPKDPQETPATPAADADPEPSEDQFPGDYRAFLKAEAAWTARNAYKEAAKADREAQERTAAEETTRAEQETVIRKTVEVVQSYAARNDEFRATTADYDEATKSLDSIEITAQNKPMVEALLHRPDSARVQYALAKHPQVARFISTLPGPLQGSALGEFAASISARPHSAAPPPGAASGGKSTVSAGLNASGSMDDYAASRQRLISQG